jgi:hypothetical protein
MNRPSLLPRHRFSLLVTIGTLLITAAWIVPLIAYAWMGTFMRYSGDDYCYAMTFTRYGFWKAQAISYTDISLYNGNRFSLTFFSGLADWIGPKANAFLPGLAVLFWMIGLGFLLKQAARRAQIDGGKWAFMVGSAILGGMTLAQAPDLYQILYWRSGMLPYLAPLIGGTFLLAQVLRQWQEEKLHLSQATLLVGLALLAGGFSETGFALQMAMVLMLCVFSGIAWYKKKPGAMQDLLRCGAALAGTLLAGLLLALSPTNQARLASLPLHPDLFHLIQSTMENLRIFTVVTLKSQFLPTALTFVISSGAALLIFAVRPSQSWESLRSILLNLVFVLVGSFLALAACFLPSAYIQSSYPELRALITARFVMVLLIALSGWLVGKASITLFRTFMAQSAPRMLAFLVILALSVFYSVKTTPLILAEQPKFQKWAELWDARDQQIRAASRQNLSNVEVMQLDHIIPNVGELSADPGYWYNQCAAGYYEVEMLSANQPGWDE